jgi:hypothetical protein
VTSVGPNRPTGSHRSQAPLDATRDPDRELGRLGPIAGTQVGDAPLPQPVADGPRRISNRSTLRQATARLFGARLAPVWVRPQEYGRLVDPLFSVNLTLTKLSDRLSNPRRRSETAPRRIGKRPLTAVS